MHIRTFRLSDHRSVNRLLEDVLSPECYVETKEALAKQLSWDSETVLVAEVNNSVVGIILGSITNQKGYYYRLAVEAEHRGQGIAKALIQGLEKRFRQRRVNSILIAVDTHNEPILSVYESVGRFEPDFSRSLHKQLRISGL